MNTDIILRFYCKGAELCRIPVKRNENVGQVKKSLLPYLKQKYEQDVQLSQIQIEARSMVCSDEVLLVGLNNLEIVEVKLKSKTVDGDYLLSSFANNSFLPPPVNNTNTNLQHTNSAMLKSAPGNLAKPTGRPLPAPVTVTPLPPPVDYQTISPNSALVNSASNPGSSRRQKPQPVGANVSPTLSTIQGNSEYKVNELITLSVAVKNLQGLPFTTGGLALDARVNGPQNSLIKPNIADLGSGSYSLAFSTVTKGFYEVIVFADNVKLPVFRFVVTVGSNIDVDVTKCKATGGGLSSVAAGANATFFIEAKDTYGNNVKNQQNFTILIKRLTDNQLITSKLTPYSNGTYTVSYVAEKSGNYEVSVKLAERHIAGSPWSVVVQPARPEYIKIQVPRQGLIGVNHLKILTFDKYGNNAISQPTAFHFSVQGPTLPAAPYRLTPQGNGEYTLSVQTNRPGTFNIHIALFNKAIPQSPIALNVPQPSGPTGSGPPQLPGANSQSATTGTATGTNPFARRNLPPTNQNQPQNQQSPPPQSGPSTTPTKASNPFLKLSQESTTGTQAGTATNPARRVSTNTPLPPPQFTPSTTSSQSGSSTSSTTAKPQGGLGGGRQLPSVNQHQHQQPTLPAPKIELPPPKIGLGTNPFQRESSSQQQLPSPKDRERESVSTSATTSPTTGTKKPLPQPTANHGGASSKFGGGSSTTSQSSQSVTSNVEEKDGKPHAMGIKERIALLQKQQNETASFHPPPSEATTPHSKFGGGASGSVSPHGKASGFSSASLPTADNPSSNRNTMRTSGNSLSGQSGPPPTRKLPSNNDNSSENLVVDSSANSTSSAPPTRSLPSPRTLANNPPNNSTSSSSMYDKNGSHVSTSHVADLKNQLQALHPNAAMLGAGDRTSESSSSTLSTFSSASGSHSVSASLSSSRGLPSPTIPKSQPPSASLPPISGPPQYPPPQTDFSASNTGSFESLPPSDLPPEFVDDGSFQYGGDYQDFSDMPSDLPPMLPPDFQYEAPAFQLTEQELKMLNFASREILSSENTYLNFLRQVESEFKSPLMQIARSGKGIREEKLEIIFSNMDIITSINTDFFNELTPCLSVEEIDLMQMAMIITNSVPLMKFTYEQYITNFNDAMKALQSAESESKDFKAFLDAAVQKGLSLGALLIMPIQRLPKYELLLREVIKYTPKAHPAIDSLEESFRTVQEVVMYINEQKRAHENMMKINALKETIRGLDDRFWQSEKKFVEEGDLKCKLKDEKTAHLRHIVLFQEYLLICKHSKRNLCKLVATFEVPNIQAKKSDDKEDLSIKILEDSKSRANLPKNIKQSTLATLNFESVYEMNQWNKHFTFAKEKSH